ncbi:MAG: UDP-N-acetylmuramoyl-tripeptide--D-alanyl-D-alanine ligase [Chloroflexi bacterium]|nr:UDP-N-acetylmuramoyl-tripeptide--D-alanyl-D-alanine ligase [Chloroflexota bacterium]
MNDGGLNLASVVEGLCGQRPSNLDQVVTNTVVDSRLVRPGGLFVALHGERTDGHHYLLDALSRGAVAAIVDRDVGEVPIALDLTEDLITLPQCWPLPVVVKVPSSLQALQQIAAFWRRRHNVRVIGITGSLGKTTTKELTAAVLARRFCTLRSEGNYNNEIGLPLTLLHLSKQHECVVLEMGMYDVGEIAELAQIALPQVGVVTMVGPIHLERVKTMEGIVRAKSELVEALPEAPEGVAILNYDDERVRGMARVTRARVFYYGLSPEADLWADDIEGLGLQGIRFQLHYRLAAGRGDKGDSTETLHVRIPLLGRHSVHTALRAAAVGLVEGLNWQEIVEGLRSPSPQLRLFSVPGPGGSIILDDTYNASPASMLAALNLLEDLDGRRIAVLGDMLELGVQEREAHEKVGMRALEVADVIITVGPRARIIGETVLRWGRAGIELHMLEDNAQAIELLRKMVRKDDMILVKGSRGMQMEEIVNVLSASEKI